MSNQNPSGERRDVWRTLLATVVGGALAAGGGIVGQYYASQFQFSSQVHLQKVQGQRQVFARLMGRKFATKQLYVSRYEAMIFSDYHEARTKRSGLPKDSLDLQEAQRWMHRSEDLVFDIVKNNQALFEDLGTVRALFPEWATTSRTGGADIRAQGYQDVKPGTRCFRRGTCALEGGVCSPITGACRS